MSFTVSRLLVSRLNGLRRAQSGNPAMHINENNLNNNKSMYEILPQSNNQEKQKRRSPAPAAVEWSAGDKY